MEEDCAWVDNTVYRKALATSGLLNICLRLFTNQCEENQTSSSSIINTDASFILSPLLYGTALHCIVLRLTVSTVLHQSSLHCIALILHYAVLSCIILPLTALHRTVLHSAALYCTKIFFIWGKLQVKRKFRGLENARWGLYKYIYKKLKNIKIFRLVWN